MLESNWNDQGIIYFKEPQIWQERSTGNLAICYGYKKNTLYSAGMLFHLDILNKSGYEVWQMSLGSLANEFDYITDVYNKYRDGQ
jgi:hypothetical protein